jgi:hypothetical protein
MTHTISRRTLLTQIAGLAAVATIGSSRLGAQTPTRIIVYKSPTCGCCGKWVEHMTANGFAAQVNNVDDMNPIKNTHKIAAELQSCHTTLVGGYVIEGHVPASDVKRLLAAKPKGIVGLTIPGMPASAPGMDQLPFVPYTVLTFDAAGKTAVYARHQK